MAETATSETTGRQSGKEIFVRIQTMLDRGEKPADSIRKVMDEDGLPDDADEQERRRGATGEAYYRVRRLLGEAVEKAMADGTSETDALKAYATKRDLPLKLVTNAYELYKAAKATGRGRTRSSEPRTPARSTSRSRSTARTGSGAPLRVSRTVQSLPAKQQRVITNFLESSQEMLDLLSEATDESRRYADARKILLGG